MNETARILQIGSFTCIETPERVFVIQVINMEIAHCRNVLFFSNKIDMLIMSLWNKTLSTGKEINRFFQMEYWIKLFNLKIVQNNSSIFFLFQRAQTDLEAMLKMKKVLHQRICQSKFRQEEERARQCHTTVCIFFFFINCNYWFFFIKVVYFWKIIVTKNNYDNRHPGVNVVVPGKGGVVG